ncbi:MAG: hypothetical protein DHS20C15_16380 [Planctomycetota bacterium]|nr:MAG: hypothetical protein DHS20C15_16380 [Planctomycetota bacterium]
MNLSLLLRVPRPWQRTVLTFFISLSTLWSLGVILHPIDPPLVMWTERPMHERPDTTLLPEAEVVELASGGRTLHGYFVPSDPGAPLVLHLMGSGLSVLDPGWGLQSEDGFSVGWSSLSTGVRRLAEAGFASLAIDYTGVGRSEGSRSTAEFRADMRVMWEEALRRSDGNASRVLIRGTSLGALGAGVLLAEGARPQALLLHMPVLGETVVDHFAEGYLPAPLPALLTPLLAPEPLVDLRDVLRKSGVPTHLFLERGDELLPEQEADALSEAAFAVSGSSITWSEVSTNWMFGFFEEIDFAHHTVASMLSGVVSDGELALLRDHGAAPNARWRVESALDRAAPELREHFVAHAGATHRAHLERLCGERLLAHPDLLLAAALARTDPQVVVLLDNAWPSSLPGFLRGKTPAQQVALLDLHDPSGELPGDLFVQLASELWGPRNTLNRALTELRLQHARALWSGLDHPSHGFRAPFVQGSDAAGQLTGLGSPRAILNRLWERVREPSCRLHAEAEPRAHTEPALARRAQRVVLKACGIPDRVVDPSSVSSAVQAFDKGSWHDVDAREPWSELPVGQTIERVLISDAPDRHAALTAPWWVAHRAH